MLCETAELQVTDCSVCENRTAELRSIIYSLCGSETAELTVKALVWKRNSETSRCIKFIVWKRNCATSKPRYFSCAEAELCHFIAPSHTLFCMRNRNCGTLSLSIFLVRRRNFKPKNIPCMEAELQNFKSVCGSGISSHIIVCMWNLSGFLCKNPKCPGAQGRRPLCQSHLGGAVLNCAILAVAPLGYILLNIHECLPRLFRGEY